MYALGACLYTLLFGRIPFSAPNLYKLFQVVQNEPVKYPPDVPISEELKDLLKGMLTKVSLGFKSATNLPRREVVRRPGCMAWLSQPCRDLKWPESRYNHSPGARLSG